MAAWGEPCYIWLVKMLTPAWGEPLPQLPCEKPGQDLVLWLWVSCRQDWPKRGNAPLTSRRGSYDHVRVCELLLSIVIRGSGSACLGPQR